MNHSAQQYLRESATAPEEGARTWFRTSLRTSILWWFMGIALAPLVLVSIFGYQTALRGKERELHSRLETVAEIKHRSLQEFFLTCERDLDHRTRLDSTLELFTGFQTDRQKAGLALEAWVRSPGWRRKAGQLGGPMGRFLTNSPYYDILLVDGDGSVLFSCLQEGVLGRNLLYGDFSGTHLGQACTEALAGEQPVFAPYEAFFPSGGRQSAFLVQPVVDRRGRQLGLLVFQLTTDWLDHLLNKDDLLGPDGQVYIVDAAFKLLTVPSRHPSPGIIGNLLAEQPSSPWRRRLEPGRDGYDDMRAKMNLADGKPVRYRGPLNESMSGLYRPLDVLGVPLGVIVEVDYGHFMSGLARMKLAMAALMLLVGALAILSGQVVSARIVRPITRLGQAMENVADGRDLANLPTAGPREVGHLAEQFTGMISKLNEAKAVNCHQLDLKRSQFELHEKMSGEPDLDILSQSILDFVGSYYGAAGGVFYLARPGQRLGLAASFGVADNLTLLRTLRFGQGVIGAAAVHRKVQIIADVPPDHFRVETDLGGAHPHCLVVAPFRLAGQIKGVLVLGLLQDVSTGQLEFLRLIAESVASALDSARSRLRVQRLLEETRRQAATLSRQQHELRESNSRLARADKYKSEFLANMSHELRTPLNSMMIMSQVLAENRQGNLITGEVEAAETIHQAGSDLLVIINDILDLSRVEAGVMELYREQVDLPGLVSGLQDLFQPVARKGGLEFQVHLEPGLPATILTDPVRLNQIMKNLLDNAFKFTAEGSVVLRVRRSSLSEVTGQGLDQQREWLSVSVADTGIGMGSAVLDHVFEAFNQGDGSIGRRYGGTGLGLSISSKLTRLLEGTLIADSVEGKGSCFSLMLPLCIAAETIVGEGPVSRPATEPVMPQVDLGDRQVLVCDEDMRSVYRLTAILDTLGVKVMVASSRRQGVEMLARSRDISLVIAAVTAADGTDAADFARAWLGPRDGPELSLVALLEADRPLRLPGVDAALNKPFTEAALMNVLANLTDPATVEVGHDA